MIKNLFILLAVPLFTTSLLSCTINNHAKPGDDVCITEKEWVESKGPAWCETVNSSICDPCVCEGGGTTDAGTSDGGTTDASVPDAAPDAGPICGDGACSGGELCSTCVEDCGECPSVCGNGVCENDETCNSCQSDCGECPPIPEGTKVEVTLKPHKDTVGTQTWVSFGVPLPSGVLEAGDAAKVVVVDGTGAEVPAFTKSLGEWPTATPPELQCSSLPAPKVGTMRAVLVQFKKNITSEEAFKVTVILNSSPTKKLETGVNPADTYRVLQVGENAVYSSRFNYSTETRPVYEPKVVPMVEQAWLACSNILPMNGIYGQSPEQASLDTAQKNYFYSFINDFRENWYSPTPARTIRDGYTEGYYDTERSSNQGWLYDRTAALVSTYIRIEDTEQTEAHKLDVMRAALQSGNDYKSKLYSREECAAVKSDPDEYCTGFFSTVNANSQITSSWKDTKYSYGEALAVMYWLTGDPSYKEFVEYTRVASKWSGILNKVTPATERHRAYGLNGYVVDYEVNPSPESLSRLNEAVDALEIAINRPNSVGVVTGCLDEPFEGGEEGFSPWMSALLGEAMLRAYMVTGQDRLEVMMYNLASCVHKYGMEVTSQLDNREMLVPFYGGTTSGPLRDLDGNNPWQGSDHSYDVAQLLAIGAYFAPTPADAQRLKDAVLQLLISADWAINDNWTRSTSDLPRFRLAPIRKFSWWFKNAGIVSWVLGGKPTLN